MYRFRALRRRSLAFAVAVLVLSAGDARLRTAAAQPPQAAPGLARGIEWTSLRLLRDKGVLSEAEYESAIADLDRFAGNRDAATLVVSKLMATVYGFVQLDMAYNSTESCQESCSNASIQKAGTYRGDHGRTRRSEDFYDAGMFVDLTAATRVGADVALYADHYVDGTTARNYSVMTTAYLFF